MSFSTVIRDIEQRIKDNWATTVVAFPNVPLKKKPVSDDHWIRLRVFNDTTNRITIGTPGLHRASGTVVIEIFTPLNKGTRTGFTYGDTLAELFRDAQFNGITFQEVNISDAGPYEGWQKHDLVTPFYWDGTY